MDFRQPLTCITVTCLLAISGSCFALQAAAGAQPRRGGEPDQERRRQQTGHEQRCRVPRPGQAAGRSLPAGWPDSTCRRVPAATGHAGGVEHRCGGRFASDRNCRSRGNSRRHIRRTGLLLSAATHGRRHPRSQHSPIGRDSLKTQRTARQLSSRHLPSPANNVAPVCSPAGTYPPSPDGRGQSSAEAVRTGATAAAFDQSARPVAGGISRPGSGRQSADTRSLT